jgi:predicted ATP-grasp superfamily ATP-dependent carboligase
LKSIIVLSVNTPIGLTILRDLAEQGYRTIGIGADGCIGHASKHCHQSEIRATTKELLIKQLTSLAEAHPISCLIAISESDIALLNEHRQILEPKLKLLIPESRQMEIVLDKATTMSYAKSVGIQCPQTWTVNEFSELESISRDLRFPLVLKWANPLQVQQQLQKQGLTLHKLLYALDYQQLCELLRPYQSIGCFPLIQTYCHGVGLGQFFLCKDGEVHLEFQHIREHEWPPEGGTSTRCRSVDLSQHQACLEQSKALLKKINWQGVAMVAYRFCAKRRQYILMEINGRFWGSLALSYHSGIGFASGLVKLFGYDEPVKQVTYRLVSAIYMIPELKRLLRISFQQKAINDPVCKASAGHGLWSLITSYCSFTCHYFVFSWKDPNPFFKDMQNVFKKISK